MEQYSDFLASKIQLAPDAGLDIASDSLHSSLKPHQVDSVVWAAKKGRALVGSSFGLGKTRTQLELLRALLASVGGRALIICPLGVKHQFTEEDGPALGVRVTYVRNDAEAFVAPSPVLITNYERVRDGHFSPEFLSRLTAVTLDEGSVLRSLGTKTHQTFADLLEQVPYRFVFTATPAPNQYTELLNYAQFLGVMDRGQALTRWFKRDSQKAGNLSLHAHHEADFWLWVSSWALFLTAPSDLGYSDEGYALPGLRVHWHLVTDTETTVTVDKRSGQSEVFTSAAGSLPEAAREKKRSIPARVAKALDIVGKTDVQVEANWLLWHHLEEERKALEFTFRDDVAGFHAVYGSQDLDERERLILGFAHGEYRLLATKPEIAGSGCNFQHHCRHALFLGIDYRFEDFIQAVHRIYRFQQQHEVEIHILYTPAEEPIRRELEAKWVRHNDLQQTMRELIRAYGLHHTRHVERLGRSMGVERKEARGERFTFVHNDCVAELASMADNSVDLIHTSIPFGNHYEYSAAYEDFGHNQDNQKFFEQMDFLVPQLLRVLKPGRIAAIHVKDRIRYGSVTGNGFMTIDRFSDQTGDAFEKHGFLFMGRCTVLTDVVRENNQTYRLGWSEQCKDGTKMSYGMPEYVLLFRKLPTDLSNAYADEPVKKDKAEYSRGRWQLDAHSLWRSSGNRLLTPQDIRSKDLAAIGQWFRARNLHEVYDFAEHVRISEELDAAGRLSSSYMMLPPQSYSDMVWTDVVYMRTLNGEQFKRNAQNHICPLPFDIVDRVIERWSQKGELVLDPFGGIGTVPYRAVTLGRRGYGVELKKEYWQCAVQYCREAEYKATVPTLFDLMAAEPAGKEAA